MADVDVVLPKDESGSREEKGEEGDEEEKEHAKTVEKNLCLWAKEACASEFKEFKMDEDEGILSYLAEDESGVPSETHQFLEHRGNPKKGLPYHFVASEAFKKPKEKEIKG